jgi:hypothetical protein
MNIKMKKTSHGSANNLGSVGMDYIAGQTYAMTEDWQKAIANVFVNEGWAEEVGIKIEKKVVSSTETKRARNNDGTLKADNPSTPDVNEAWEGGKAPAKTSKKSK